MEPSKKPKITPWEECPKSHLAFQFAYIGFNYDGVSSQQNTQNTIEHHIFQALLRTSLISDRKTCNYSLCGRTDKGVSALCNVFSITLRSRPAHKSGEFDYKKILNGLLPDDIRIISVRQVPFHFDAREYKYFFIPRDMDLARMNLAAQSFVGIHDFRNFCKEDPEKNRTTERRVLGCKVELKGGVGVITVTGYSFLWHQVRCMVSVLFTIGEGSEDPSLVERMLRHKGEKPQYSIASEIGLVLYDCGFETVDFSKDEDLRNSFGGIEDDILVRLEVVRCLTGGIGGLRRCSKKIRLKG